MILTDNRSYMSPPVDDKNIPDIAFGATPEELNEILDMGREYAGGSPPENVRVGATEVPNPQRMAPPQSYLGVQQMAWVKDRLRKSKAPWKIWGHSFGTLKWRTDPQNMPAEFSKDWPGAGYGVLNDSFKVEHADLFGMIEKEGITGLAIVAGDKHSFWAGYPTATLPPRGFNPVGVEFITGSISAQGLAEVQSKSMKKDHPLRPLYFHDRPDGSMQCTFGMTLMHGVQSSLTLKETGDPAKAAGAESIRYADRAAGIYKRLWVRENRLQAAVLYGDTRNAAWYADLIEHQRDISPWREELLLGEAPMPESAA